MALQAAVEGRSRQMLDGRLQGVKAVVQRQQGVLPECNYDCFFFPAQSRRRRILRTHPCLRHDPPLVLLQSPPPSPRAKVSEVIVRSRKARATVRNGRTGCEQGSESIRNVRLANLDRNHDRGEGGSAVDALAFHLATVLALIPYRLASVLMLS